MPIFMDAICNDDAEPMRQTLFDPSNLAQPIIRSTPTSTASGISQTGT
jgi:hypothetical protein